MTGCSPAWPITAECSGKGVCDTARDVCVCADGWISEGEIVASACLTSTVAIRVLWAVALLIQTVAVAAAVWIIHDSCRRVKAASGSAVSGGAYLASPTNRRASEGGGPGTGGQSLFSRLWSLLAFRMAFCNVLNAPILLATAVLKFTRLEMVGHDLATTILLGLALIPFWLAYVSGVSGFVDFNVRILRSQFSAADRDRLNRHLQRMRWTMRGVFLVFTPAAVALPFGIYELNRARGDGVQGGLGTTQDVLAMLFTAAQAVQTLVCTVVLWVLFRQISMILRGRSTEVVSYRTPSTSPHTPGGVPTRGAPADAKASTVIAVETARAPIVKLQTVVEGDKSAVALAVAEPVTTANAPGSRAAASAAATPNADFVSPERLIFADELDLARGRLVGLFRNQFVTYTILTAWPLARTLLAYQSPLAVSTAGVAQMASLWAFTHSQRRTAPAPPSTATGATSPVGARSTLHGGPARSTAGGLPRG